MGNKRIKHFPKFRFLAGTFIFVLSYAFLAWKLITFDRYPELTAHFDNLSLSEIICLVMVLLLVPLNWLLESVKWKMLVQHVEKITLGNAIQAVLSGIFTGFFTPNRIGELVGRIGFLQAENRKAGTTLSLVNSLTQNLMMALGGIPACILFFMYKSNVIKFNPILYLSGILSFVLLSAVFYFFLPKSGHLFKLKKIASFTACLSEYSHKDLLNILLITFVRYIVFCVQFYFMLLFFGVDIEIGQALIAIPTSYLFVSFTPSVAFSEAAVRSTYAVLVIGAFSNQEISILLAGTAIWFVNFVMPMSAGSIIMLRNKNGKADKQTAIVQ